MNENDSALERQYLGTTCCVCISRYSADIRTLQCLNLIFYLFTNLVTIVSWHEYPLFHLIRLVNVFNFTELKRLWSAFSCIYHSLVRRLPFWVVIPSQLYVNECELKYSALRTVSNGNCSHPPPKKETTKVRSKRPKNSRGEYGAVQKVSGNKIAPQRKCTSKCNTIICGKYCKWMRI